MDIYEIFENKSTRMKYSLDRMHLLVQPFTEFLNKKRIIHVAGTNGKGSTTLMMTSVLQASGASVGTFISPHIHTIHERIQVNNTPISPQDFERIYRMYEVEFTSKDATPFEMLCCIAFAYFEETDVDFCVFEAGLGGRLDATNVLPQKDIAILTNVSLDHMHILGDTKEKIRLEKIDIFRNANHCIFHETDDCDFGITDFIMKFGKSSSSIHRLPKEEQESFRYTLGLRGAHQYENAKLVYKAAQILELSEKACEEGFKNTKNPGRLERVLPNLLLDGAHNEAGIEALIEYIESIRYGNVYILDEAQFQNIRIFVSILERKASLKMKNVLERHGFEFYVVSNGTEFIEGTLSKEEMKAMIVTESENTLSICTGSLYFISDIRSIFVNNELDKSYEVV